MIRVLGIDPGLASTGYGVIESDGSRLRAVDFGVIRTPADKSTGIRLKMLYDRLSSILAQRVLGEPEKSGDSTGLIQFVGAGVESLFFARNASSAIPVAQARGVILLALAKYGIPTGEYPPQMIKQAVVGAGQADKEQVQQMVRIILGMKEIPRPDHAADALAAAITHFHNHGSEYVS